MPLFQLDSVFSTNTSHQHALLLQPHDTNVVAAAVRPAILHALVSLLPFLFRHLCGVFPDSVTLLSVSVSFPPVSYWLPPPNTSGQTSHCLSPTSLTLWTSDLRPIAVATQRSRWMPRAGRSSMRRSWTGIGWTGCTRFHALRSYLVLCTSTHPSVGLSWCWWPCWCFTCECSTYPSYVCNAEFTSGVTH